MKSGHISQKRERMTCRKPRRGRPVSGRSTPDWNVNSWRLWPCAQSRRATMLNLSMTRASEMKTWWLSKSCFQHHWLPGNTAQKWCQCDLILALQKSCSFVHSRRSNWPWPSDLQKGCRSDEAHVIQGISRGFVLRLPSLHWRCHPPVNGQDVWPTSGMWSRLHCAPHLLQVA